MNPRILFLDIETAPHKGFFWGRFDQNIAANQVEQSGYTLCWSAKWFGESKMRHESVYEIANTSIAEERPKLNSQEVMIPMLAPVHKLLDEADIVVHYNGLKFDIPILNKEFVVHGFTPPSPYKQLDILQVARRVFRFDSNKLSEVLSTLGLGDKIKTDFTLWTRCMDSDPKAWAKMLKYNANDVKKLEKVYKTVRPWITHHPNMAVYKRGQIACPKCGSTRKQSRGTQVAVTQSYLRYQCQSCGGWYRGTVPVKYSEKVLTRNIV